MKQIATISLTEFEVAVITSIVLRNKLFWIAVNHSRYSFFMEFTEQQLSKIMYFMKESKLKDRLQRAGNNCFRWF
jgi:hypothetical protein